MAEHGRAQVHTGTLWSRAVAREIVLVIARQAENGQMPPAAAMDLIDRVWDRATAD